MSSVNDIRPYFKEDIKSILSSIYISSYNLITNRDELRGFVRVLVALALSFSINPQEFINIEDLKLVGR